MGLRLRDLGGPHFTWVDLRAIVKHSPEGSALRRAMGGPDSAWTLSNQLLATATDALRWLVWAKTEDAPKKRNRPKPIPRPGVTPHRGRMKGARSLPIDEVNRLLALPRKEISR